MFVRVGEEDATVTGCLKWVIRGIQLVDPASGVYVERSRVLHCLDDCLYRQDLFFRSNVHDVPTVTLIVYRNAVL